MFPHRFLQAAKPGSRGGQFLRSFVFFPFAFASVSECRALTLDVCLPCTLQYLAVSIFSGLISLPEQLNILSIFIENRGGGGRAFFFGNFFWSIFRILICSS